MTWLHHWWVNIGLNNDCQATSHYLDQCLAKFVCHYLGANELIYSQTVAEPTDFSLVVCMASNLIFRKQRYSGRRRSYIYPTWKCRIAISSTLVRGLCRQPEGYSFALATPGGACLAAVFCWSCRETVCHPLTPGQPLQHGEVRDTNLAWVRPVAASATHGSQWHKTMLGQSHHGMNSYKGRHKQRKRSKRFPIYRLRRLTRLHRNRRRHTQ